MLKEAHAQRVALHIVTTTLEHSDAVQGLQGVNGHYKVTQTDIKQQ